MPSGVRIPLPAPFPEPALFAGFFVTVYGRIYNSMKLVLLHHGTTDYNERRLIDGQLDASRLTEQGRREARRSAVELWKKKIKPDVIVSSDLYRTLETSAFVQDQFGGEAEVPIYVDKRLREINMGKREGTPMPAVFIGNIAAHILDGIGIPYAKSGESNLETRERIDSFFDDFFNDFEKADCAVIVTHQLPMQHAGKIINQNVSIVPPSVEGVKGADMWYFDTSNVHSFIAAFSPSESLSKE